jgi:hypothetical protein
MFATGPTPTTKTTAVNIALGRTKTKRFSLPNSKVVWTEAHMDTTKDRKRVRLRRTVDGKTYTRYVTPHTQITAEV